VTDTANRGKLTFTAKREGKQDTGLGIMSVFIATQSRKAC
jgi:hypothetical protein